jgi:hypothetical protein
MSIKYPQQQLLSTFITKFQSTFDLSPVNMLENLPKFHRFLLLLSLLQQFVFGLLPFKFDKTANRVVTSTFLTILNQILTIFFVIYFCYSIFIFGGQIVQKYQNTKHLVSLASDVVYMAFIVHGYIFVCLNREEITKLLNELIKFSSIFLNLQTKVNLFSRFFILQNFLFQPLISLHFVHFVLTFFFKIFQRKVFYLIIAFLIYPARNLSTCVCLLMNFCSALFGNFDENSHSLTELHSLLGISSKVCSLFESYVKFFIAIEYSFIVSYLFGIFCLIIDEALDPQSGRVMFIGIYFVNNLTETCNLIILFQTCKNLKSKVRKSTEEVIQFLNSP